MSSTVTSQPVFIPGTIYNGAVIDIRVLDDSGPSDPRDIAYELGLWFAGLEAFITRFEQLFADSGNKGPDSRYWQKALRLTKAGLLRCSDLHMRLRRSEMENDGEAPVADRTKYAEIAEIIRSGIVLNESLAKPHIVRSNEWKAWRTALHEKLTGSEAVSYFQSFARNAGEDALPAAVRKLIEAKKVNEVESAEICGVLREFAAILKALGIVGRMLRNDEPLKPTLLIFAFVYEKTQHLISQINQKLSGLKNEETEFFIALDAASYTASLEIKKAFNQELAGVVGIRPAQLVYARIEVAQALLSASFEEIITSFAKTLEPSTKVGDIFPSFKTKLEQSLMLRSGLVTTLRTVQEAEERPTIDVIDNMRNTLELFNHEAFHFLYHKDKETVERFIEEIQFTGNPKDLVPILHRFGAYLETLLGQVNMRAVLANHPLEENK